MEDVTGLYIVTAVVLAALFLWVVTVLIRAKRAPDLSSAPPRQPPPGTAATSPAPTSAPPADADPEGTASVAPDQAAPASPDGAASEGGDSRSPSDAPRADDDPPAIPLVARSTPAPFAGAPTSPAMTSASDPLASAASASPVVVLPPIRQRLDSHPEIQDTPSNAPVIVMPKEAPKAAGSPSVGAGLRLSLVTAFGRTPPDQGKQPERHSVLEREHLFSFADGSGRKAGSELVSAVALAALTENFLKNTPLPGITDDPKLPERANRLRRSVLATNRALIKRAREMAFAGLGASAFAAYFSPTNDHLFIAHVGANRAYRLRRGKLERLTAAQGNRQIGLIEKVDVEVLAQTTEPNDTYLFCSERFASGVSEAELCVELAVDTTLEDTAKRLIGFVHAKEKYKDAIAIVVKVQGTDAPLPEKSGRVRTVLGIG